MIKFPKGSPTLIKGPHSTHIERKMLTAAKNTSRPALTRARSSFNAGSSSRAASMLASNDIFDTPGRLIFEEDPMANSTLPASRKYYPSHFRPLSQEQNAQGSSSSSSSSSSGIPTALKTPSTSTPHVQALAQQQPQTRQLSTLAHHRAVNEGSTIMYDGPARPRNPPRVTSRHVRAASTVASTSASASAGNGEIGDHHVSPPVMPDPIIYDGPARPPRKVPVQMRKSSTGADVSSSAVVGAVVGLVGLGAAYELYDAHQNPQATPKNIMSYSRSRETVQA